MNPKKRQHCRLFSVPGPAPAFAHRHLDILLGFWEVRPFRAKGAALRLGYPT